MIFNTLLRQTAANRMRVEKISRKNVERLTALGKQRDKYHVKGKVSDFLEVLTLFLRWQRACGANLLE